MDNLLKETTRLLNAIQATAKKMSGDGSALSFQELHNLLRALADGRGREIYDAWKSTWSDKK